MDGSGWVGRSVFASKGYHQESSEADVFAEGARRLLANILKTLTGSAMISLAATPVLGLVGALIMYLGAKEVLSGSLQLGELGSFTAILLFVVSPLRFSGMRGWRRGTRFHQTAPLRSRLGWGVGR